MDAHHDSAVDEPYPTSVAIHWMDVQCDSVVDEPNPLVYHPLDGWMPGMTRLWMNLTLQCTIHWMDGWVDGWMPGMTQLWMNLTFQCTIHWMDGCLDGWMFVMSYYNSVMDEIHSPSAQNV
jgi:hypothetical protein